MLVMVSTAARPTCQRATLLLAIRTAMRTGANGGSSEHTVARGPDGVGRAITTYNMRIEGRDEWLAAARRQA